MSSRPFACTAIFALGIVLAPAARAQFQEPTAPDPVAAVKVELLQIDMDALKDAYRQAAKAIVMAPQGNSDQDRDFIARLEKRKAKLREEILRMAQELAGLSGQATPPEDDPKELQALPERGAWENNRELPPKRLPPKIQILPGSPEARDQKHSPEEQEPDGNEQPSSNSPSKPPQDEFKPAPIDTEEASGPKAPGPNPELDELHSKIRALEEENTRLKDIQSARSRLQTLEEENTFLKTPQPEPAAEVPQPVRAIPEGPSLPQPGEDQSVPILPTSDQAKPDAGPQNLEPVQLAPATPTISPTSAKEPGIPLPTIEPIAEAAPLPPPAAPEAPKAEAGSQLDEIGRKLDRLIELLTKERESALIAPSTTVPH